MRIPVAFSLCLFVAAPAFAEPVPYLLQPDRSTVAFETDYGNQGLKIKGQMPVAAADLTLDLDRVAGSQVNVSVNAAKASTSNPLATEAMTGKSVLFTREFPTIRFESTRIRPAGDGAEISGNMTIRGVTRPVTLAARIYRQNGPAEGDLSNLSILLTGAVSRSAFGATGFADMVGDEVRLKILARIGRGG